MRTLALASAVAASLGAALLSAAPALAQDPGVGNEKPDATMLMTATAANLGVGYTWGNGVLHFRGHQYHFTVKGINVAAVGYAKVTGRGRVYHLNHEQDFSGTYAALTGQATVGTGLGGQILRNGNGVMIRVDQVTKGANLAGSADGVQLTLVQ